MGLHESLNKEWQDGYYAGYDAGRVDGYHAGWTAGSGALDALKKKLEAAIPARAAAEETLARLTDALGWDRFDVARFREHGIIPALTPDGRRA